MDNFSLLDVGKHAKCRYVIDPHLQGFAHENFMVIAFNIFSLLQTTYVTIYGIYWIFIQDSFNAKIWTIVVLLVMFIVLKACLFIFLMDLIWNCFLLNHVLPSRPFGYSNYRYDQARFIQSIETIREIIYNQGIILKAIMDSGVHQDIGMIIYRCLEYKLPTKIKDIKHEIRDIITDYQNGYLIKPTIIQRNSKKET